MSVLGIDVSHHQGIIDWPAVGGAGVQFAYVKATEGTSWVDPRFEANWRGSQDEGLLHGAYHFARPGSDPEAEAAHFAAVVGAAGWDELRPVLDLESGGGLPPSAVIEWVLAFVRAAESRFGRTMVIYTGGFWRRALGNPEVPTLGSRLLWTARYGPHEPVVPRTWKEWTFWQFTDGQSGEARKIPGVRGPCDCDWYRGSLKQLVALANEAAAPAPVPPPPPLPLPAWPGRYFVWPQVPAVRGEDVRAWQTRMQQQYAIRADGSYGPESKRACVALQRDQGLEPDGIVGPATWAATFALG